MSVSNQNSNFSRQQSSGKPLMKTLSLYIIVVGLSQCILTSQISEMNAILVKRSPWCNKEDL